MTIGAYTRRSWMTRVAIVGWLACGVGAVVAPSEVWARAPRPGETNPALLRKMQLSGAPSAHLTVGTQVRVTGYVRNTDNKQHDVYLAAALLDARGHIVGRATGLADNVKPGARVQYSLTGSSTAPSWQRVTVTVTRVTENVAGEGTD